jgi:hypothetical protein
MSWHIPKILRLFDILYCWLWQRFNQGNVLKRTIFELIAQELLQTLVPDPSVHGASAPAQKDECAPVIHAPPTY